MLTSLALIFLGGLAAGALCRRLRLPRIVGMLAAAVLGILVTAPLGPSASTPAAGGCSRGQQKNGQGNNKQTGKSTHGTGRCRSCTLQRPEPFIWF